jgi:hypothetical protein
VIYQARIGLDAICFESLGPAQLIPTNMIVKMAKVDHFSIMEWAKIV